MKALLVLTLLAATSGPSLSVVYSRYPSGRPRFVVTATRDPDELLLLRYRDARGAEPRVVDREALDGPPSEVWLERVIDPNDVIVSFNIRHGSYNIVDRIVNQRFVRICDGFREAIDLDGDGVPEIIDNAYGGQNDCGVYGSTWLQHWNGKRYVGDERRYLAVLWPGAGTEDEELHLSSSKRYAVRLFGPGRVTLDGERIEPGKVFTTEEDCHKIALHDAKPNTRAFLEELP
jgi:hypothetical protein